MPFRRHLRLADLRGIGRLAIDATIGITDLVEAMHRNIASTPGIFGDQAVGGARGLAGLVYRSVRGTTRLIGGGIDAALAPLVPLLGADTSSRERNAVVSALNGIMGDHLQATRNPLALRMNFCVEGDALPLTHDALAAAFPHASGKIVILVHGLCMNDQQWLRAGHDHGVALGRDLGYSPLYLRYNTGLPIAANGRSLAAILDELVAHWPVKVREIVVLAHSMGGLVARSAFYVAGETKCGWPAITRAMIFLGTPHHGAPLERGGHWLDTILAASPYVAPFARIGQLRSAGITGLRYGHVHERAANHAVPTHLPLPAGTPCFAIAASASKEGGEIIRNLLGDGLVPVASALGRHKNKMRDLAFPLDRQWIGYGMNHMDLLSATPVYEKIRAWLA